jgi:hypothetical protein
MMHRERQVGGVYRILTAVKVADCRFNRGLTDQDHQLGISASGTHSLLWLFGHDEDLIGSITWACKSVPRPVSQAAEHIHKKFPQASMKLEAPSYLSAPEAE